MLLSIRDAKGQGAAALYVRFRNVLGQFWDLVAHGWVGAETADCRTYLAEFQDADTLESRYQSSATPPLGEYIAEYVRESDGLVLGEDANTNIELPILSRIAGLLGANKVVDQEVLDSKKRVTSARMRVFDRSPTDENAVVLATYIVAATYSATGACTMTVAEVLS